MIFIFIALSRPVSDKFAVHLARFPRKSVPGVSSRRPPGTEFPRKCSRCLSPPSTWHGISAKAFQVSLSASHLARNSRESVPGGISLPSTWHGFPAKAFQVSFPAVHLARNSRKSVAGSTSYRPPGTEFLQKCSRCLFSAVHMARYSSESVPGASSPPSTWHGIPAKAFQVPLLRLPPATVFQRKCSRCLFSAFHLPRFSSESVPGGISLPSTWHGFPAKAFQVSFPASHLARNSCKSVPGVPSCFPPATESPRKRSR